jgi:hypothetical protein
MVFSNMNMESDREKYYKWHSDTSILKPNADTDIYISNFSEYEYI